MKNKGDGSVSDLVSIIIPVYNMEKSLSDSVNSILRQDYENIEVILVDDGSKDGSYDVCRTLASKDDRVRCIHTENRGSGPARNTGIEASSGRYLYFPDADDYLEPNAISVLAAAMDNGKYDLVVFGYKCLTSNGDLVSEKKYEEYETTGENVRNDFTEFFGMSNRYSVQGAPWNKFFDGETVRKNKISYPPLRRHQDEGFIARYITYCENIHFIPDVLYSYYQNTAGLEWKKYPADYIDAVLGLRDIWNETLMRWNPSDISAHTLTKKKIFSKIIKALELSYSPKMGLNFFSRRKWLAKVCGEIPLSGYEIKIAGSLYQRIIWICARMHMYYMLSLVLYAGTIRNVIRQGK